MNSTAHASRIGALWPQSLNCLLPPMTTRALKSARGVFLLALLIPPLSAAAGEIYRWVDETGRTQISDTVPERYRATAKRYDARQYERTEEQQRRAAAEASETARALEPPKAMAPDTTAAAPDPAAPTSPPSQLPIVDPNTGDCDALHLQYKLAQECFAPYRTREGRIRGAAFQYCTDVPAPPKRCGIQKLYR